MHPIYKLRKALFFESHCTHLVQSSFLEKRIRRYFLQYWIFQLSEQPIHTGFHLIHFHSFLQVISFFHFADADTFSVVTPCQFRSWNVSIKCRPLISREHRHQPAHMSHWDCSLDSSSQSLHHQLATCRHFQFSQTSISHFSTFWLVSCPIFLSFVEWIKSLHGTDVNNPLSHADTSFQNAAQTHSKMHLIDNYTWHYLAVQGQKLFRIWPPYSICLQYRMHDSPILAFR